MPADTAFRLRRMAPSDVDAVQYIWSTRFGGDPSTQENWIEAALASSHSAVGLIALHSSTDEIVGLSLLDVSDPGYTRRYLGVDTFGLHPSLADKNGIFHLSCVRADWEGCGVGSAFYEQRLAVLSDRDISRAFGIAWHRPHAVDSRVLFEKYRFTRLATVEQYYNRSGGRPHCPVCSDSCTCTASLYARTIEHD